MKQFIVNQISNGYILRGPRHMEEGTHAEIFLLTIHAVADILTTWDALGFPKALARTEEKYHGR